MRYVLLVDFGSTYTKLTAVDLKQRDIIATSSYYSTVFEDIKIGYLKALDSLEQQIGKLDYDIKLACSSAKGGLKMAAIGLVPELTVEAAKRTCMGAGAKVEKVFSFELTKSNINAIKNGDIDIILLAGGTDGGNQRMVRHNIKMIAEAKLNIPIIYAGNQSLIDDVKTLFDAANLEYYIVPNIMGKLNKLNMHEAKATINDIFLRQIIKAKGIKDIETLIDRVIYPTPEAVIKASLLLSKGVLEDGLGDLMVVDVGGATTDVYSMSEGIPSRLDVIMRGLEEPFDKRTVEGDLGLRFSSKGILNHINEKTLDALKAKDIDMVNEVAIRTNNPTFQATTDKDLYIDSLIAKVCVETSVLRHVGRLEPYYTLEGNVFYQTGKDLSKTPIIIGTGGPIIYNPHQKDILSKAMGLKHDLMDLRPKQAQLYIDKDYILQAMGLLLTIDKKVALEIMKKRVVKL